MVVACSNCTLNLVHLSLESVATSKTLLGTIFGHLWIFRFSGLSIYLLPTMKVVIHYKWDHFLEKGPSAYIMKFPVRAIEM